MGKALSHRGPDDSGVWASPSIDGFPAITLVHRRLAIQDLSPAGHQPMVSTCGRYVLVFNGEIYNQRELRGELEHLGHRFRSTSDTEVLLALYAQHGLGMLQRLRGMYAFALVDRQQQRVLLARDPFGIKPLYLWHGPGGQLLFASELRALLASGLVPRQLDGEGLSGYLLTGSVPEPLTLVAGVRSLPAGWLGIWEQGGWQTQQHWHPVFSQELSFGNHDAAEQVRCALADSVQAHHLSDVPVGLFLSGGIDSCAILALSPTPPTTLTIGFPEVGFDESARAAASARHFGATHIPLELSAAEGQALLPAFLASVDQPSVDGFNTYFVAKLARCQGLKVALSGLGGDELFGGYKSFRLIPRLLRFHAGLGPLRLPVAARLARSRRAHLQRLASFLRSPASAGTAQRCLRGLFSPSECHTLLRHWDLPIPTTLPFDPIGHDLALADPRHHLTTPADQVNLLEITRYLGSQLLRDSDTYSMAHGLELRIPWVDAQLFRVVAALPSRERLAPGKRLFHQAVPEVTADLGPIGKQGFLFPFQRWFEDSASRPQVNAANIDLTPWARRWGLMVLQHWLHQHLAIDLA